MAKFLPGVTTVEYEELAQCIDELSDRAVAIASRLEQAYGKTWADKVLVIHRKACRLRLDLKVRYETQTEKEGKQDGRPTHPTIRRTH